MNRELGVLSRDPLQIFEHWDRIPDGIYEERHSDGWLSRMFSEPVQTRHKKGKVLSVYNGRKGFLSIPEYSYVKVDLTTIQVFKGEKTFFSIPLETYVITLDKIEIYDGDKGFFSTPKRVIERRDDSSTGSGLMLLSLLGLVLFGVG